MLLAAAAERTKTHPAHQRGHRAVLRRSGARLPAIRHARSSCPAAAPRSWPGAARSSNRFPLFGYDLNDYDELFAEKLDLLLKIRDSERVTWSGEHRAPLNDQAIYPRTPNKIPIWVAVGGTPQSAVRAGTLGLPLALAIIGGEPERFAPFFELYREAAKQAGHDPTSCRSASTRTASSPRPRSRRPTSSSRATPRR